MRQQPVGHQVMLKTKLKKLLASYLLFGVFSGQLCKCCLFSSKCTSFFKTRKYAPKYYCFIGIGDVFVSDKFLCPPLPVSARPDASHLHKYLCLAQRKILHSVQDSKSSVSGPDYRDLA